MPVDAYCKGCIYLGTTSVGKCCDYNYLTGKARGCPGGEGCVRREFGTRRRFSLSITSAKHADHSKKSSIESKKIGRPRKSAEELDDTRARELERKRKAAEKYRAIAQGRQREAIMAYKAQHNASSKDIATLIGVNPSTVQKWCTEYIPAKWDLLAKIGIKKPKGLD